MGTIKRDQSLHSTKLGYRPCSHPVTVYNRAKINGFKQLYWNYYPTVTGWGQYPRLTIGCREWGNGKKMAPSILLGNARFQNRSTQIHHA